jgi:tetratricopeptide (TPR) repeat protein
MAVADRNLVPGILAAQLDFVSRDALFGAMNAWAARKATPPGALLVGRGDLAGPEAEHRESLRPHEKLVADNPAVAIYCRDLARAHEGLGIVLSETGRSAAAGAEYRRAQAIHEGLVADRPTVTEYRNGLAISRNNLGWLLSQAGRPAEAEGEYRKALALYRKLADEGPNVPSYRSSAANVGNNLSVVHRRLGHLDEALALADQAVTLRERLVEEDPLSTGFRGGLAENYLIRGLARRAMGDVAGAGDIRRALAVYDGLATRDGEQTFLFGCARASLAGLAGRDGSGVSAAEGDTGADAAMALLRKAVAMGYHSPEQYRTEDALDLLRDREDFKALMAEPEKPAAP